ncbi:MAG TPA: PAS-domain containing protein, partial [Ramlibacter sp.]|nr:PAS-domain containing protein [Ramlibacter sp.]
MTPATIPDDEPRRFEQDLLERTVLLESVLENLPSGLVVYDANLRLRMSNAAWRRMHDVPDALADAPDTTLEAILRCNAERGEYGPGDIDALVAERLRSNMHEGTIEFERTRPNGTVLRARSRKMPNGWYVKIFTDVTEERATLARLRASEERLALALETTGLGIWEYEVLADRVHLSDAWSRMFGYPPQLRAMTLGELNALAPPHRRAEIQQALLAVLKGQSSQFLLEHEMFDAQGRMLWVVTHARVAERNAQGRTVRMVGVTRDVTERHSQDDALRHAVDAANKANQAKA